MVKCPHCITPDCHPFLSHHLASGGPGWLEHSWLLEQIMIALFLLRRGWIIIYQRREGWKKQEAELGQREDKIKKRKKKVTERKIRWARELCFIHFFSSSIIICALGDKEPYASYFCLCFHKANFIFIFNDFASREKTLLSIQQQGQCQDWRTGLSCSKTCPDSLPRLLFLAAKLLCRPPLQFHRCVCWWNHTDNHLLSRVCLVLYFAVRYEKKLTVWIQHNCISLWGRIYLQGIKTETPFLFFNFLGWPTLLRGGKGCSDKEIIWLFGKIVKL